MALEALWLHRADGLRRPLVLMVGQQHGDEPAGAEALLILARQVGQGDLAPLLGQIEVLLLPRANPDGAGWQRRTAGNGLDINRDHLLQTPEASAVAGLVHEHRPVVVVDAHKHIVVGRYKHAGWPAGPVSRPQ